MLWMFQRVMYGKLDKDANRALPDLTGGEKWALVPLVLLIFLLGVYPTPTVLDKVNPSVTTVLAQSDPQYNDPFAGPSAAPKTALDGPRVAAVPAQPKGSNP